MYICTFVVHLLYICTFVVHLYNCLLYICTFVVHLLYICCALACCTFVVHLYICCTFVHLAVVHLYICCTFVVHLPVVHLLYICCTFVVHLLYIWSAQRRTESAKCTTGSAICTTGGAKCTTGGVPRRGGWGKQVDNKRHWEGFGEGRTSKRKHKQPMHNMLHVRLMLPSSIGIIISSIRLGSPNAESLPQNIRCQSHLQILKN